MPYRLNARISANLKQSWRMQGDLSYSGEQSVISQKPSLPLQIKYRTIKLLTDRT